MSTIRQLLEARMQGARGFVLGTTSALANLVDVMDEILVGAPVKEFTVDKTDWKNRFDISRGINAALELKVSELEHAHEDLQMHTKCVESRLIEILEKYDKLKLGVLITERQRVNDITAKDAELGRFKSAFNRIVEALEGE